MSKRLLIVYGSHAGSTSQIADSVGNVLARGGFAVDIAPAHKVQSIDLYDVVVVGTSIRAGRVNSEISKFVSNHREKLGKIPVAYFVVCLTMKDDTPQNRKTASAYLDPLRAMVTPVEEGLFAGVMDYSKLGFFARFACKRMVKAPEGDFRNWDAIQLWANGLVIKLRKSE